MCRGAQQAKKQKTTTAERKQIISFSRLENNQPDIIPNVSSGTKIETIIFYMIAVYLHSPNILRTAFLVLSLLVLVDPSPVIRLCLLLLVVTILQPIMVYITTSDTIGTKKKMIEENS